MRMRLFLHQQGDSQRVISQNSGTSQHGMQCVLKNLRKLENWRTKEEVSGLKTNEEHLKVMSL